MMERKQILISAVVVGLLLALAVGMSISQAQEPEPPDDPEVLQTAIQGKVTTLAAAGVVSPAISYQGRLTDNDSGDALDGTYDFQFRFYDAESGGDVVDGPTTVEDVDVNEGLFNIRLPISPTVFSGQALWMQLRVREDGGSYDPWMTPLKEIRPVPYAMSLRPGAIISDSGSIVELNRFREGFLDTKIAVYGEAEQAGTLSTGVYGMGSFAGLYGQSDYIGVYGYSSSSDGTAVYAQGDAKQNLSGNGLVKAGVYAQCSNLGSNIERSFNNVNSTAFTIADGADPGECTIDLGFDVSNRFWVATAVYNQARIVTCRPGADSQKLDCHRFRTDGTGRSGLIMLLVY
jgi:hypothetical protein